MPRVLNVTFFKNKNEEAFLNDFTLLLLLPEAMINRDVLSHISKNSGIRMLPESEG